MPSRIEGFRLAEAIATGWEEAGVATREDSVAAVLREVWPVLALATWLTDWRETLRLGLSSSGVEGGGRADGGEAYEIEGGTRRRWGLRRFGGDGRYVAPEEDSGQEYSSEGEERPPAGAPAGTWAAQAEMPAKSLPDHRDS